MNIPRVIIAGTHSGCGTTSVALGVLRALTRSGLRVQPFTVGPDYIEPALLTDAAGRSCRTLDSWMLPHPTVVELLARGAEGADAAVIEGMLGLYDGHGGKADAGSAAEVAHLVGAPVILIVDVGRSARSAAAAVLGFVAYDPELVIAGVIANRVDASRHEATLWEALQSPGIPLLGAIPWDDRARIPQREPGVVPAQVPEAAVEALAEIVASRLDLEALLRVAHTAPPLVVPGPLAFPPIPYPTAARIGIARDEASRFYYQDALEMLEAFGGRLVPFSLLRDRSLPDVDGLYLGGGFPEGYARQLEDNAPMRRAVAGAIHSGMPVYAEGGGLLYLAREVVDADGRSAAMAGVVPAAARLHRRLLAHDYVTLEAEGDSLLLRRGETVRAHEFQSFWLESLEPLPLTYRARDGRGIADGRDGFVDGPLLASSAHLHFAAMPETARRFIDTCRAYRARLLAADGRAGSR